MPVELVFVRDPYQIILYLFLSRVFACPIGIWFEGVGVEVAENCMLSVILQQTTNEIGSGDKERRTITTTARVYIIVPCPANLVALFDDDEVASLAAFDQIDGGA